jgi:hypothetical protein
MAKKTGGSNDAPDSKNWGVLNRRNAGETLQNRDVYDTQQLERGTFGKKQTFTFRHIMAIAAGVLIFILVWMFYSLSEISGMQRKIDAEASRIKPITEMAPEEPRELKPVQWLNLELVARPEYEKFGYFYGDYATKSYYTEAEYEIWAEVNRKFYERSETVDYYPEIWRYQAVGTGKITYQERPYVDTAPALPRDFTLAEYANMKIGACHAEDSEPVNWHCYHDKGYLYRDYTYQRFISQVEYDKWQEIQNQIPALVKSEAIVLNKTSGLYEMPGESVSAEEITEDAGDRVLTPIELDDIVWANMDLVSATRYTKYRYFYADRRTGKFYTTCEYNHWADIKAKVRSWDKDHYYWREINEKFGGYDYYLEPPTNAPTDRERDEFRAISDLSLLLMYLVEDDYWAKWGYIYVDANTGRYYSAFEFDRYRQIQGRVQSGEVKIPASMAAYITANNTRVTNTVRENMPVEPKKVELGDAMKHFNAIKLLLGLVLGAATYAILRQILWNNLQSQNMMEDASDINQYENDQHIALPEEIQRKFDWFPDVGAHCPVMVSSMVSHMMLNNKGIDKIKFAKRAKEDIYDSDGNLEYYKGEILLDENGEPITELVSFIDEDFGDALFETSGNPKDVWKKYSTLKIPYNPGGKNRSKQAGKWATVAEMINKEWKFPLYEPQRPAGAFLVDTEPVNTMV